VPVEDVPPLSELTVRLEIRRGDEVIVRGEVSLGAPRRTPAELLGTDRPRVVEEVQR